MTCINLTELVVMFVWVIGQDHLRAKGNSSPSCTSSMDMWSIFETIHLIRSHAHDCNNNKHPPIFVWSASQPDLELGKGMLILLHPNPIQYSTDWYLLTYASFLHKTLLLYYSCMCMLHECRLFKYIHVQSFTFTIFRRVFLY